MLYEKLNQQKKKMGITTEQLSRLSGVPVGTINKILRGETKAPRYDTLQALEKVLLQTAAVNGKRMVLLVNIQRRLFGKQQNILQRSKGNIQSKIIRICRKI